MEKQFGYCQACGAPINECNHGEFCCYCGVKLPEEMIYERLCTLQLQQEIQSLKLAASQAAQNQYLINKLRLIVPPAYLDLNYYVRCGDD